MKHITKIIKSFIVYFKNVKVKSREKCYTNVIRKENPLKPMKPINAEFGEK